jgi:hypothetical protein
MSATTGPEIYRPAAIFIVYKIVLAIGIALAGSLGVALRLPAVLYQRYDLFPFEKDRLHNTEPPGKGVVRTDTRQANPRGRCVNEF